MKKFVALTLLIVLLGCSSQAEFNENEVMNNSEIKSMFVAPEDYKDRSIIITGQVFSDPEVDGDEIALQLWNNPRENEGNFIVYGQSSEEFKMDDYVLIKGVVGDIFEGENAFGGELSLPTINAISLEKTTYENAEAPALKTQKVNKKITKHGVSIRVNKIDFAEEETRVYVNVTNNTKHDATIYSFNSKIIDNNKNQYSESDNAYSHPNNLESDLSGNAKMKGVLVFKPIKVDKVKSLKLKINGSVENYNYDELNYTFSIKLK